MNLDTTRESGTNELKMAILVAVRALAGSDGYTPHSAILKRLQHRCKADELRAEIAELIEAADLFSRVVKVSGGKGRPAREYRLTTFARHKGRQPRRVLKSRTIGLKLEPQLATALTEMARLNKRSLSAEIRARLELSLRVLDHDDEDK